MYLCINSFLLLLVYLYVEPFSLLIIIEMFSLNKNAYLEDFNVIRYCAKPVDVLAVGVTSIISKEFPNGIYFGYNELLAKSSLHTKVYYKSSKASCLYNTPNNDFLTTKFIKILPGETFEVDKQCELQFGKGYKLCPYSDMPPCGSLWCATDDLEGCKTQHMPWADGTLCGDLSWCHHGECIAQDRLLLQPIQGGWGEWQEWGPCSRTCGGGVRISRRACDSPPPSNGGAYCTGSSVQYESCNYHPCDPSAQDIRDLQCAEFNGVKVVAGLESNVEWIPKYGFENPDDLCKLYCRVKHSSAYYMFKKKVIDGTKCSLNTFDICVNGVCRPGGCDNRLDSKTELDECGICGGDNSKCEEISGTYNVSSRSSASSYKRVVRIPKGSSNIYILQKGFRNSSADDNYLALVDGETGSYVLNGDSSISRSLKDVVFGDMTITYSGSDSVVEYIKTPKNRRLSKDLILEVLSVGKQLPPDISYRYTIRRDSAPRYGWHVYDQQWTKCSSLCSGKQYIRPVCIDLTSSKHVQDIYCSDLDMNSLVQQKDCNSHCQFNWNVHTRGHCSSQCGKGYRTISYKCVKIDLSQEQSTIHNHRAVVNDKHCSLIPKPPEKESCEGLCGSTRWEYDDWSQCTKTCGGGSQRRNAKCLDANDQVISESQCNENEKVIEQICNNQNCPVWSFDDWTPCSVTCGKGYRTRPYYCHVDGHSYNVDACDPKLLPVLEEECNEQPCVLWSTGKWGECNVTCGSGIQEREVSCRTFDSTVVDEEYCNDILKPNSSRMCVRHKCEDLSAYKREYDINTNDFEDNLIISPPKQLKFRWVTGAWSKCTKPCETGTKSRMVICRNTYGEENERACDPNEKPIQSVECNGHSCPTWNFGAWSSCDINCEQHRQVSCQNSSGAIVEDEQCDLSTKPYGATKCNTDHCIRGAVPHPNVITTNDRRDYYNVKENRDKQYKWKFGRWGRCSKSCGKGTKTRSVRCVDIVNAVTVVDQYCRHLKKPKTTRSCERNNCDYVWVEDVWSPCSQTCGEGFKYRNVSCHKVLQGYVDPTPLPEIPYNMIHDNYCDMYNKPPSRSACIDRNCNDPYSWSVGPWGQCSHHCGKKGRQIRPLYCLSKEGKKVKQRFCPKALKPRRRRRCNRKRCLYRNCKEVKHIQATNKNRDYYLLINGKPALVYCYKMDTQEPEEFISLKAEHENFAEMYDKSLHKRESCPSNGQRRDNCDCILIGPDRSGITVFWKVRLNITSLQIINNDYTFSRQIKGNQIPYGTAGDCYSAQEGCIQGMFSINLTNTSFRLSQSVRWIHNGNRASSQINKQERMVRGKCGGFCGSCMPDPNVGLAVEIT